MTRTLALLLAFGFCMAPTFAASETRVAGKGLNVQQVEITGGRLVIAGSTAKARQKVTIVGTGFTTTSGSDRKFGFTVDYRTDNCRIQLQGPGGTLPLMIGRCAPKPDVYKGGYIVFSREGHNGNFGGLSGAASLCLNEITSRPWEYRLDAEQHGMLDSTRVTDGRIRAFLCDTDSKCTPLTANTDYKVVERSATGFEFNAGSNGTSLEYNDYMTTLNDDYWTGMQADGPSGFGANQPLNKTCSNWSSTSGTGMTGAPNYDGYIRIENSLGSCADKHRFACVIDP